MATGLEALGAASAILQTISFASDLISVCKKIYDGQPTPDNDLEEHAKRMSDALNLLQGRCQATARVQPSEYDNKLDDVVEGCKKAARDLQAEVSFVTGLNGNGSLIRALNAALRTSSHRKKIERLEISLSRHGEVMEVELMSHLCSRIDATQLQQKEEFKNLAMDVQSLVARISQGYTRLEDLVRVEHDITRDVIVQEAAKTGGRVNEHVTAEIQQLQIDAGILARHQSFLQSLKFPEMNQRYNDLMNSRSATFKRVFAAYQDIASKGHGTSSMQESTVEALDEGESEGKEIDTTWAELVSWLQSRDSLFCIRGKPGSGKSTLVKFVVDHQNTKQLLRCWNPEATVISHFFWKIGSSTQNSIKGMLSSLVYQILSGNQEGAEYVMDRFDQLSRNTNYYDWSTEDLETVLCTALEKDARYFCIFIDGLDEICNKDGLSNLIQLIEKISLFSNVKVCAASRPETFVMNWLKRKNIAGLLLEDLTRPDMRIFVHNELEPFLSNNAISVETHDKLVEDLVWKAQGVFLWLHLATRSLINGIHNEDSEEMLLSRLKELPSELKQLYADMWQRLNEDNAVYRQTAARYFQYALQDQGLIPMFPEVGFPSGFPEIQQPVVFQIACAESVDVQQNSLTGSHKMDFSEVHRLCTKTELAIQTRCAGLLRVRRPGMGGRMMQIVGQANELDIPKGTKDVDNALFSRVIFIHRTAHDFFTDTETGQEILRCGVLSDIEVQVRLLKGLLCLLSFLHREYGIMGRTSMFYKAIQISKSSDNQGLKEAVKLFEIMQELYDKKVIGVDRPPWQVQAPFLSHLTDHSQFDDFVISKVAAADSRELTTSILREAWGADNSLYYHNRAPTASLIKKLISMGADPNAYGLYRKQDMGQMEPFMRQGTAFTNLLMFGINSLDEGKYLDGPLVPEMLKAAVALVPTCPDLSSTTLVIGRVKANGETSLMNVTWLRSLKPYIQSDSPWILYEVDLKFLLLHVLSGLGSHVDEQLLGGLQILELLPKLENPSAKIRYIITCDEESDDLVCHRVASHASAPEITERLFAPCVEGETKKTRALEQGKVIYERTMGLTRDESTKQVDLEAAILSLAGEKLGFCTLLEAGIIPTLSFLQNLEEYLPYYPLTMEQLKAVAPDLATRRSSMSDSTDEPESDEAESV